MPVPTLDDDCSTAYDALERLVTASVQVITYLDNLTDDLPEGADAIRAFRDSHAAWFGQELTRFLACILRRTRLRHCDVRRRRRRRVIFRPLLRGAPV